jgi:hypothetical protein
MTGKELQRWESLRKHGGVFFVLVWGLLVFGDAMFLFDVCWGFFGDHKSLFSSVSIDQIVGDYVVAFFGGWAMWFTGESRYHKAILRESTTNKILPE